MSWWRTHFKKFIELTKINSVKYFIVTILICIPIFGHIGSLPFRFWDESRLAINAYEMNKNGNWIVIYFDGKPDMWNTKPPLMIWSQVIFMKLFGVNELSVRMPSALAAFFTSVVLMIFSVKYLNSFFFGFVAVIVLITSSGYIGEHVARTGDYDALLILFTSLYCLFFFLFIETKGKKYIYLFFISFAFAVLTKSSAGLFFLPGLVIYVLVRRQFLNILTNKHFYLGLFLSVLIILSYYFLRETQNHGYLKAVAWNEFYGRYLKVIAGNEHTFLFYYNNFINSRFTLWFLFIPLGLIAGLFNKDRKFFNLTLYLSILTFTFFILISVSKTKLIWYDAQMYPFLAMIIATFFYYIFVHFKNSDPVKNNMKSDAIILFFLSFIFIVPYQKIINKVFDPTEDLNPAGGNYELCYFLQEAVNGEHNLNNYFLAYNYFPGWENYDAPYRIYLKILQDKGINIAYKDCRELNVNDKVIVFDKKIKKYIDDSYNFVITNEYKNTFIYKIYGNKNIN